MCESCSGRDTIDHSPLKGASGLTTADQGAAVSGRPRKSIITAAERRITIHRSTSNADAVRDRRTLLIVPYIQSESDCDQRASHLMPIGIQELMQVSVDFILSAMDS